MLYLLNRYTLLVFALDLTLWGFVSWEKDENKFWTTLIFLLGFVPVPPNISSASRLQSYELTCDDRVAVASEVSIILMEVLVLGITWYRTAGIVIAAKKVQLEASLVSLMLRDGTTFFGLTLALHIIVIIVDQTRQTSLGLITCTFMSIIMTRFFLNLRSLDHSRIGSKSFSIPQTPSTELRFSSPILDNMGAPLDVEGDNDDPDYDYDRLDDDVDGDNTASTHQELIPMNMHSTLGEYAAVSRRDSIDRFT
ncbi:hypothetical protein C8Q79DRAFT_1014863 [Trametes meyenii]|nr:hypothetical protein C8Q79DRAFT_1014863 [Trametes meyenii]